LKWIEAAIPALGSGWRYPGFLSPLQPVAHFAHGQDVPGAEFAPQLGNVRVNGAADDGLGVAPDFAHQLEAGGDGALAVGEGDEEVVLLRREVDALAAPKYGVRGAVELEVVDALGALASGAAQQCLDARQQLEKAERLRQVIVRAELEAA